MSKYLFSTDLYDSILEASERGELWGIEKNDSIQLEITFDSSAYNLKV